MGYTIEHELDEDLSETIKQTYSSWVISRMNRAANAEEKMKAFINEVKIEIKNGRLPNTESTGEILKSLISYTENFPTNGLPSKVIK